MSHQAEQSWDQGFMGAPTPQPQHQPHPTAQPTPQADPQSEPPRGPQPYHRYVIPKSVVSESLHWKGSDSDLIFGMREPTGADAKAIAEASGDYDTIIPQFITMIGDRLVTDYTQAQIWWSKVLTIKAKNLVAVAFVRMVIPQEDEGKGLFDSRRRVV